MNLRACGRLTLRPLTGVWYRALSLMYWPTRLSTARTMTTTSRFSGASPANPGYRVLHLADTHQVALYEVRALYGSVESPVPEPKGSWAILSIDVRLDHIIDLTLSTEQTIIRTTLQELTGVWAGYRPGEAPTHRLGRALHDIPNLEGFLCPSTQAKSRNLLIFPEKLGPRSSISFFNEITNSVESLD